MKTTENTGDRGQRIETIYREVGPELKSFLQRRHRDAQTAEDLLQETFNAVLKDPDRLLRADSPRAYLFGVARNLSAEWYRRSRPTEELAAETQIEEAESTDPRLAVMREAILRLNAASQQVLELRLDRELSYEEMAATLGVPIGTVRSRLHHAVRQLREYLKKSGYEQ